MTTRDELMVLLKNKFPNIWTKPSEEFNGKGGAVWTGTDSYIDSNKKIPAFNPFGSNKKYEMDVHVDLVKFLNKYGYYVESYDCGTYFIYSIN